ncbi:FecR domain-containing protein [Dasania marina]|mgnify:CR=1 FL=1|uniref:FecR family protein n=1 Tax=Dasania marina TaxID=471499 RepID=UPI0030DA1E3E|tara:strand:+ start:32974 stop:33984 length:1011 start_codon:yes stop_codon:yes gene_type:complete
MKDKSMNKTPRNKPDNANISEDAKWFAKLQADSLNPQDSEQFCAWLAADPDHEQKLEDCEQAWDLLGELKGDPELDQLLAQYPIEDDQPKTGPAWYFSHWAKAASFAMIAVALSLLFTVFSTEHYQTRMGEQRSITLKDGSTVLLNSNTLISVDYSNSRRSITLQQGEALFKVAHNKTRPFEVTTGNRLTRAVGTSFNIAFRNEQTTVSVLEGTIKIEPTEKLTQVADLPLLNKGDELIYWANGANSEIHAANLDKILAITEGKILFEEDALSHVIEEYNKYSAKPIVIGSAQLNDILVSGVFRINDAGSLLFILEQSFDIAHINREQHILLIPKN